MELLYNHILYVEDDHLDILNMQWLADSIGEVKLKVLNEFKECEEYLENNKVDLVILDQYIKGEHFSKYPKLMSEGPYMVLTNGSLEMGSLKHKPIRVMEKPLYLDEFSKQIQREEHRKNHPSLSYFEGIEDKSIRAEMLALLKTEFANALDQFPELVDKKDYVGLKEMIHKLGSKFSLMAMKDHFHLAKALEKELMAGQVNVDKMFNLFEGIQSAFELLSKKEPNP